MTAVPADEAEVPAERAQQFSFSRVQPAAFLACFFALGWLPGRCWLLLADAAVAMRLGYRRGRGLPPPGEPDD